MVDTGILFNNMKSPSHVRWMTFWPLAKNDFPTDQTFNQFHALEHMQLVKITVREFLDDILKQDKSSDIEQQPPFGDRKISNIQPQNRGGGGFKTNRNII